MRVIYLVFSFLDFLCANTNVAGRQGGGREIMSATVKQRKARVGECYLEEDQRRVTLPQRLK
jgi:hypothetical protein